MKDKNMKPDYIIRATAASGMIRAFASTTRGVVEEAKNIHHTWPVATAALGRLLTAGLMMGYDMKDERDLITLKINCSGSIKGLLVSADRNGHVKGYVTNPDANLPPSPKGKLDVGRALDLGVLSVIKDIGLKEPYVGQTELITGEIAEDLAYYFAKSEQVPSTVALGVLMDVDNKVNSSGGFIIQLLPGAEDDLAEKLEENIKKMPPVTSMLCQGLSPENILKEALSGFELIINNRLPCEYRCDCNRERVTKALLSVGKKELKNMLEEGQDIEIKCQFCQKSYIFTSIDLSDLLKTDSSRDN